MPIERERVTTSGFFPPWIRHEHFARYDFAVEIASGKTVVDCACSDGTYAGVLAARAGAVHGFDLSAEAIAEARRVNAAPNVHYEVGDALALPLPDGFAEVFVSLETIEHLPDAPAFLREIVRVLGPGGVLVCSTPDRDVYSPGHGPDSTPWNRFHFREYTREELLVLLGGSFAGITLYGQNPQRPAVVGAMRALGRLLPANLMVRCNQALKLPRFLHDPPARHAVVPADPSRRYEILVAVCSQPIGR